MCHLKLWAITDFVITTMTLERCNKEVMRVNILNCVVAVIYKLNGYDAQRRETSLSPVCVLMKISSGGLRH